MIKALLNLKRCNTSEYVEVSYNTRLSGFFDNLTSLLVQHKWEGMVNLNLRVRKSRVPSELLGSSVATLPSHKCESLNLELVKPCRKNGQSESPLPAASSHLASSSSASDAKVKTCLDFPRENASEYPESNEICVEINVECALSAHTDHEFHEPVHPTVTTEVLPTSTTVNLPDLSAALVPTKSRVRIGRIDFD